MSALQNYRLVSRVLATSRESKGSEADFLRENVAGWQEEVGRIVKDAAALREIVVPPIEIQGEEDDRYWLWLERFDFCGGLSESTRQLARALTAALSNRVRP